MTQQYCYIHVRGYRPGARIGIVKYLDRGYYPSSADKTGLNTEDVDKYIDALNASLGVSSEVRAAMEAGSMFGWRVPAAIPALKHFGAPEIDPEEEKLITSVPPKETEVDAGPCLTCGHPPRCHGLEYCADGPLHGKACGAYVPDPGNIIKIPGGTNA
jgi:hypothetical protein